MTHATVLCSTRSREPGQQCDCVPQPQRRGPAQARQCPNSRANACTLQSINGNYERSAGSAHIGYVTFGRRFTGTLQSILAQRHVGKTRRMYLGFPLYVAGLCSGLLMVLPRAGLHSFTSCNIATIKAITCTSCSETFDIPSFSFLVFLATCCISQW